MTETPADDRSRGTHTAMPAWILWHAVGLGLVLAAPAFLRWGDSLRFLRGDWLPQILVMGLGYLATVAVLARRAPRRPVRALIEGGLAGAVCFGGVYLLLLARPDVPHSRVIVAVSAALGTTLATLPWLLPRLRLPLVGAAGLGLLLILIQGDPPQPSSHTVRSTALGVLSIQIQDSLLTGAEAAGGALEAWGGGFLLVTGTGRFHRVTIEDDSLAVRPLDLQAPINRLEFIEDQSPDVADRWFRVADLTLRPGSPTVAWVSHDYWDRERRCFTERVSRVELTGGPDAPAAAGEWTTIFEADPCLEVTRLFDQSSRQGGTMALRADGGMLLTLGDQGFDGVHGDPISQLPGATHGRIVDLDPDSGEFDIVARGLRNPQGLVVAADGRVWFTDQGPQGGDEINLLVEGGDYGWPSVTYGTQYGMRYWPTSEGLRTHGEFVEPRWVWVPSVAISGLMEVRRGPTEGWQADLVGISLRARSLFRIRTRGDDVVYAEPIDIGARLRDIAEAPDGSFVILADGGRLIHVTDAELEATGEVLFAECATCHEGPAATAPSLRGVYRRKIAGVDGYAYSSALAGREDHWDEDTLGDFLREPGAFAPGTTMEFAGIRDPDDLAALMEYLKHYR